MHIAPKLCKEREKIHLKNTEVGYNTLYLTSFKYADLSFIKERGSLNSLRIEKHTSLTELLIFLRK
jgi:hypothetical protein